nr:immunoglobulin heavy chain junction region [Mus musculus]
CARSDYDGAMDCW